MPIRCRSTPSPFNGERFANPVTGGNKGAHRRTTRHLSPPKSARRPPAAMVPLIGSSSPVPRILTATGYRAAASRGQVPGLFCAMLGSRHGVQHCGYSVLLDHPSTTSTTEASSRTRALGIPGTDRFAKTLASAIPDQGPALASAGVQSALQGRSGRCKPGGIDDPIT